MRSGASQESTSNSTGIRVDEEMDGLSLLADHDQGPDDPSTVISDNFQFDTVLVHSHFENYYTEIYPGAAKTYGRGLPFLDKFDRDQYSAMREENLYYPWASQPEWELASFLLHLSLSMAAVDQFLSLDLVSQFILFNCCI